MTPIPTPANDNTPRPQWFDELLLKYRPHIRKQCLRHGDGADDLMQDVIERALSRWQRYRTGPQGCFSNWLTYLVREIVSERKRRGSIKTIPIQEWHAAPQSPAQEHAVDLSLSLRSCTPTQRTILLMQGCGYLGREIAAELGMSRVWAAKHLSDGRELIAANDNVKQDKKAA